MRRDPRDPRSLLPQLREGAEQWRSFSPPLPVRSRVGRAVFVNRVPWVYILRCADGSLYTGAAKGLRRRLGEHAGGRASRYTRGRRPVTVVWSRRVRTWSVALRTERQIKALRRTEKDALIRGARRLPRCR